MNTVINTKNANIIIDYNEVINLFLHTLNIYGLLGNHGNHYSLRQDEKVIKSIDEKIKEDENKATDIFRMVNFKFMKPE